MVSVTVLIAGVERLRLLSLRPDLRAALTFEEADVVAALEAIVEQRPSVIAFDEAFAITARGIATMTRISADPSLTLCEVRIVAPDRDDRVVRAGSGEAVAAGDHVEVDERGTRTIERTGVAGIAVALDGNPATLIDLSVKGAQVMTTLTLRPGQRVRLSLPYTPRPIRLGAIVSWANFEMPQAGPRFRAGLEFAAIEQDAVERFLAANGDRVSGAPGEGTSGE